MAAAVGRAVRDSPAVAWASRASILAAAIARPDRSGPAMPRSVRDLFGSADVAAECASWEGALCAVGSYNSSRNVGPIGRRGRGALLVGIISKLLGAYDSDPSSCST